MSSVWCVSSVLAKKVAVNDVSEMVHFVSTRVGRKTATVSTVYTLLDLLSQKRHVGVCDGQARRQQKTSFAEVDGEYNIERERSPEVFS